MGEGGIKLEIPGEGGMLVFLLLLFRFSLFFLCVRGGGVFFFCEFRLQPGKICQDIFF